MADGEDLSYAPIISYSNLNDQAGNLVPQLNQVMCRVGVCVGVHHQKLLLKRQNPSFMRVPPLCTQVLRRWLLTIHHQTYNTLTITHYPIIKHKTHNLINFNMSSRNNIPIIYLLILLTLTQFTLTYTQTSSPLSLLTFFCIQMAILAQTGYQNLLPSTSFKSKVCLTPTHTLTHTLSTTSTHSLTHALTCQ
jgi:hypothetical protein